MSWSCADYLPLYVHFEQSGGGGMAVGRVSTTDPDCGETLEMRVFANTSGGGPNNWTFGTDLSGKPMENPLVHEFPPEASPVTQRSHTSVRTVSSALQECRTFPPMTGIGVHRVRSPSVARAFSTRHLAWVDPIDRRLRSYKSTNPGIWSQELNVYNSKLVGHPTFVADDGYNGAFLSWYYSAF